MPDGSFPLERTLEPPMSEVTALTSIRRYEKVCVHLWWVKKSELQNLPAVPLKHQTSTVCILCFLFSFSNYQPSVTEIINRDV